MVGQSPLVPQASDVQPCHPCDGVISGDLSAMLRQETVSTPIHDVVSFSDDSASELEQISEVANDSTWSSSQESGFNSPAFSDLEELAVNSGLINPVDAGFNPLDIPLEADLEAFLMEMLAE